MPKYVIETEDQSWELPDGGKRENWHATISDDSGPLIDRDGDTESEAITIAVTELLGNLPSDFPAALIGS
jgi:hypothetical protein